MNTFFAPTSQGPSQNNFIQDRSQIQALRIDESKNGMKER